MPSPMDECDNLVNIETSPSTDQTPLKRKLDGNSEELSFPCKKVAMSPIPKLPSPEGTTTPTTASASASTGTQVKLTKAEREWLKAEKAKEREAERQKREEEKQKREEEKQKREEERVRKQAERDEVKRKRDAEKEEARKERERKEREKEEQRRKKEEEIEKKNKAQLRLNTFFSVPKKKPESPTQPGLPPNLPKLTLVESISDYQRYFQPFHVRQGIIVAPLHQFTRNQSEIQTCAAVIDSVLTHPDPNLPSNVRQRLTTLIPACSSRRPRGRTHKHSVKEIISLINQNPDSTNPCSLLKHIPRKHLQHAEDVRPAYNGTFTRRTKLTPRNPFKRDPETFAYDYDSEAEWEFEPEDGENLDDESNADDEEMGSMMGDSGDDEDRAFLDDEDEEGDGATKSKGKAAAMGKRFAAPLVPVIKGVCWETEGVQGDDVLAGMRATILLFDDKGDGLDQPINPFSAEYWAAADMPPPPAAKLDSQMTLKKGDTNGVVELVKTSGKSKSSFPDALLGDFLKAIQGTTYNQIFLVEILKKKYPPLPTVSQDEKLMIRFPSATKGGIAEKLKEVAFRTGRKDTDHWEIRKEFLGLMGQ